jgi:hypothetical protein
VDTGEDRFCEVTADKETIPETGVLVEGGSSKHTVSKSTSIEGHVRDGRIQVEIRERTIPEVFGVDVVRDYLPVHRGTTEHRVDMESQEGRIQQLRILVQ